MSSLAIVAIPSENDYVYKISSEKVPHLTLLFLGDDASKVKNLEKIIGFVEHAANTSLKRFGVEVDRRGTLGPEEADVLFFSMSKWSGIEDVKKYRAYLLQEPNIRTAYDSATQFPEWQPHLTLGYPATPAKPDERDYPGITYVNFDRIAVWFGDYEGVEFPLKSQDWDIPMDMAMSSLTHISEKPWSDYTEADYTLEEWHAACLIHLHDGSPTSKSECKLPVKTPGGALNRNGVHAAAAALAGARSPIKASAEQKAKAASALRGYYKQLDETPPDSLKQSAIVEDFLEHIGVKGMRWGIRRKATVGPEEVIIRDSRRKIGTSGGAGHPAHPDAVRARKIGRVGQKSGLKALSNNELRDYANRLQLEQNVKRLNYNEKNRGQKFVSNLLGKGENKLGDSAVNAGAVAMKSSYVRKKAASGAAALALAM